MSKLKSRSIGNMRETFRNRIKSELNETEVPEILEYFDEFYRIKKELDDSGEELRDEISKIIYKMLPRKRDSVYETVERLEDGKIVEKKLGVTFRLGKDMTEKEENTYAYRYGHPAESHNKPTLGQILSRKDKIVGLFRAHDKRKQMSDMLNRIKEYREVDTDGYDRDVESEKYESVCVKAKDFTTSYVGKIRFKYPNKHSFDIQKIKEIYLDKPDLIPKLELIVRHDKEIKKALYNLLQERREKVNKLKKAKKRIKELGYPYLVQDAL